MTSKLPPAVKFIVGIVIAAVIFATIYAAQTARAEEPAHDVIVAQEVATSETEKAPTKGWFPRWGFCLGDDDCKALATRLQEDLSAKYTQLEELDAQLTAREDKIAAREQSSRVFLEKAAATELQVSRVKDALVQCLTTATESLNEEVQNAADAAE